MLRRDDWGRLIYTEPSGKEFVGVEPLRAFPFSDPQHWISLYDSESHELLCIRDPDELPPPERSLLLQELAAREFMPEITRIVRMSPGTDPTEWVVETDRGPTVFMVNSDEDLRRLPERRLIVKDSQGMRYSIRDTRALDAGSRKFLAKYL